MVEIRSHCKLQSMGQEVFIVIFPYVQSGWCFEFNEAFVPFPLKYLIVVKSNGQLENVKKVTNFIDSVVKRYHLDSFGL